MFNEIENRGVIVIVILLTVLVIYKNINRHTSHENHVNTQSNDTIVAVKLKDLIEAKHITDTIETKQKYVSKPIAKKINTVLFDFDPNYISKDSLVLLGVGGKTAHNWTKYVEKGGKFSIKSDVKKIYGMNDRVYAKIEKYIQLPDSLPKKAKKITSKTSDKRYPKKQEKYDNPKEERIVLKLNSCSEEELKKLKGIGEKLSKRIVKFRKKLGGFVSIEQLKEVYGLSLETYESIKGNFVVDSENITTININNASYEELKKHIYIKNRLAKQLVNYRKQHGAFKNIDDIKKIKSIEKETLDKIAPYLVY